MIILFGVSASFMMNILEDQKDGWHMTAHVLNNQHTKMMQRNLISKNVKNILLCGFIFSILRLPSFNPFRKHKMHSNTGILRIQFMCLYMNGMSRCYFQ